MSNYIYHIDRGNYENMSRNLCHQYSLKIKNSFRIKIHKRDGLKKGLPLCGFVT